MSKKKAVSVRVEEDRLKALYGLAGTFGATPDEVIEQALPDVAVTRLFFQCKIYFPELRWDDVADVGREAIRKHLRARYMEGMEQDLARFGVTMASSADEIHAAKKHAIEELRADTEHPLVAQLAKAEGDSVYLGFLYEAWKQERAGEPGYTIEPVDLNAAADAPVAASKEPGKSWALLKDGKIV
jgi:hypothetical protein